MAVDQTTRRVKSECTVWHTHVFLKVCISTLTLDSPGVSGNLSWCWVSFIDFNMCSWIFSFSENVQNAAYSIKHNMQMNGANSTLPSPLKLSSYWNSLKWRIWISIKQDELDLRWRLREHIYRANCLFECRLWIHIYHRYKSRFTTRCFITIPLKKVSQS